MVPRQSVCVLLVVAFSVLPAVAQQKAVGREQAASEKLGGQRYALIIGINDYKDPQIPDLAYAEADARAVYEVLTDPAVGAVPRDQATLLLGTEASTRAVRKALAELATLPRDATVFVFFSGHGDKETGEAYWVTHDAELGLLGGTALSNFDIQRYFGRLQTQRVITLLDCCYAAATVKEQKFVDLADALRSFTGRGRVTITASGSGEEAIEAGDLRQGVFAYYLLRGMRGAADGRGGEDDGVITITELATYLEDTVADAARSRKGVQKPNVFMEEVEDPGKFLVTVNPQRLQELAEAARLASARLTEQLDRLKDLFVEDKLTADQYKQGRRLIEAATDRLDAKDRERRQLFLEVVNGQLPPHRLQTLLDAIAPRVPSPPPSVGTPRELVLDLGGGEKLELVLIPAGRFQMGSPESEEERDSDEYQHWVRISRPFYMGKYEVTQGQWRAVMGSNPSYFKGCGDDCPVEKVSWEDATEFCRRLSARAGREIRLPTEAEWEYACRGGSTGRFGFGDSDGELYRYGNYCDRSNTDGYSWQDKSRSDGHDKTAPVGSFSANGFGLYDMHGNVREWCSDWYAEDYYKSSPAVDPAGPGSGSVRVLRGGSWGLNPRNCRSANRDGFTPGNRYSYIGFRISSGTP